MVSSARNVRYWEGNERITLGSWQLKEKRLLVITIARRLNQNALTIADEVHQVGGDYFADPAQKNDDWFRFLYETEPCLLNSKA